MHCVVEASKLSAGGPVGWTKWETDSVDLVDSYLCSVDVDHGPPGVVQSTRVKLFDLLCLDAVKAWLVRRLSHKYALCHGSFFQVSLS
jgi:hypothetical protein